MAFFRRKKSFDPDARSDQLGLKHGDLLVMSQLIQHGADLTQPRHTVYYLYFDDGTVAVAAADEARNSGFSVDVRDPDPDVTEQWAVVCERDNLVLDPDTVRENSDLFDSIAAKHSGVYDGWEAAVS
jgi:hypothetical protein